MTAGTPFESDPGRGRTHPDLAAWMLFGAVALLLVVMVAVRLIGAHT